MRIRIHSPYYNIINLQYINLNDLNNTKQPWAVDPDPHSFPLLDPDPGG